MQTKINNKSTTEKRKILFRGQNSSNVWINELNPNINIEFLKINNSEIKHQNIYFFSKNVLSEKNM